MANEVVEKTFEGKKKKKVKKLKVISFDEEVVPKHVAEKLLLKEEENLKNLQLEKKAHKKKISKKITEDLNKSEDDLDQSPSVKKKKKKKKQKSESEITDETQDIINDVHENPKKKRNKHEEDEINENSPQKKKKRNKLKTVEAAEQGNEGNEEESNLNKPGSKEESIRERKRKRHAQLLEEKKIKTELALQQKSLNYLSKWKHSRVEWKFEKLRQIWLQHNMYDIVKVPEEFWETLVEYFTHCKGKARDVILKAALKLIEEENPEDNNEDSTKIERARDIIQNLQE